MKPLKLTMQAFGPYAARQELDFRKFDGRPFFLIHGPTGSGKTTILDAMSFALYGEASGGERDSRQMRSDHADAGLQTGVTLDFSLGSESYRVTRSPEQERAKKRGEGTTTIQGQATLWHRTGVADDENGSVLASQWSRVTEKIAELLGFQSSQFRQVVMLPQGQFRKLLVADSKDREAILEKLFQTELYRRIEEALKEGAKHIKDTADDLKKHRASVLKQADAESEDELRTVKKEFSKQIKELDDHLKDLREREKKSQQEFLAAQEVKKKIEELKEAEESHVELESKKKEIEKEEKHLERARKAAGITDVEAGWKKRAKEHERASQKLAVEMKNLESASAAKKKADEILEKERQRDPEREKARKNLDRLSGMTGSVKALSKARDVLDTLKQSSKKLTEDRDNVKRRLREYQKQLKTIAGELEKKNVIIASTEAFSVQLKEAKLQTKQSTELETLRKDLHKARADFEKSGKRLEKTKKDLLKAKNRLEALEKALLDGQAAALAGKLVPGKPCPVCGSAEHPQPAVPGEKLPGEAQIDEARGLVRQLEENREEAQKEASEQKAGVSKLEGKVKALEEALDELAGEAPAFFKDKLTLFENQLKEAKRAETDSALLKSKKEKLEKDEQRSGEDLQKAGKALSGAEAELGKQKGVVLEREQNVPPAFRKSEALEKAVDKAEALLKKLTGSLKNAKAESETAGKNLCAREAAEKSAREAVVQSLCIAEDEKKKFTARLKEAGFTDGPDYTDARLDQKEIAEIDKVVRSFHENRKSAEDRLSRAEKAAGKLKLPDIAAIEETLEKVKKSIGDKIDVRGRLSERAKQIGSGLKELKKTAAELKAQEEQYAVMGRISEVANGKNALRMTFQRFVLATLLDDVLISASRRLRLMSRSRFDLQRSKIQTDQRTAGGLDLMVYDSYTGTTRPVNTLSGGEGFLASLSLALGLADVVQGYAGGIRLETIFVDEGFGSLDPESLDLAFRALVDLQAGGRLVGIISHVPELKERIDVRLEITPGRKGSEARFVI